MFQDPRLNYQIAAIRLRLAFLVVRAQRIKAGFRQDQSRGSNGRWDGGNGSVVKVQIDKTGNPRIDAKTELLMDVVAEIAETIGNDGGAVDGIKIHTLAAAAIRALDIPGIGRDGVEQSFSGGDIVRYGLHGSIRTDIVARDGRTRAAPILAVWDIKIGDAELSPARVARIRAELGVGKDVPVIQIHVRAGISVKNNILTW